MAIYVELTKDIDNENEVIYWYGDGINMTGKIRLDKNKQTIEDLVSMDTSNPNFYFMRAGQKLAACYRDNDEFPEKLFYCA